MGLDWVAYEQDDDGKWECVGTFRGKGVSYDQNILDAKPLLICGAGRQSWNYEKAEDICYGNNDHGHQEMSTLPYMFRNEKWKLITLIDELLRKPPCDIKLESSDDTYGEWRDFMEDASCFLKENERVFCWF